MVVQEEDSDQLSELETLGQGEALKSVNQLSFFNLKIQALKPKCSYWSQ